jgi:hypothetical protein
MRRNTLAWSLTALAMVVVRKNLRPLSGASDNTVFVMKSVQDWASDD